MKPKDLTEWARREDIAETALFLVSPGRAKGITGQSSECRLGDIAEVLLGTNQRRDTLSTPTWHHGGSR